MSLKPTDLSGLKLCDLEVRPSKVEHEMLGRPWRKGGSLAEFVDALPGFLAADDLKAVAAAMVAGPQKGAPGDPGHGSPRDQGGPKPPLS